jgi:hypothetical protein
MQPAIDRVIKTYVMMADLTSKRHSDARAKCPEIWRTEALTSRCRPLNESSSCQVCHAPSSCSFSAALRRVAPAPDRAS